MRQSGVLAAAGLLSVTCMADRLEEDHRHATQLAEGLNAIDGLHVDVAGVDTNIVSASKPIRYNRMQLTGGNDDNDDVMMTFLEGLFVRCMWTCLQSALWAQRSW